jgi:hypothetical protein
MTVSLKDAVIQVRQKLGELQPWYWSDDQIIRDLNNDAREMCSYANALTKFGRPVLQTGTVNIGGAIPTVSTPVNLSYAVSVFTITNQSNSATLFFNPYAPATAADTPIAPGQVYTYNGNPIAQFYILGSAAVGTYNVQASNGIQEVALDGSLDRVKSCKYFMGQLFPLQFSDWKMLQTGAATGSIPLYYYIKTFTKELTPQLSGTSDIGAQPILSPPLGTPYRSVLGVWPIPPTPATIEVWYSYEHPWMQDPTDPAAIPSMYLWPWACGTIGKSLLIEKAYQEAQFYDAIYQKGKEDFRLWMSKQQQADRPARYGSQRMPWTYNPSSSVVFVDPFSGATGV